MKILVLGGTKFAGIHLVNELLSNGHEVTIATRGKTQDSFGDSVKRKVIERQNHDSLFAAFNNEFYDVVVDNLAYCSNDVRVLLDVSEWVYPLIDCWVDELEMIQWKNGKQQQEGL